MPKTSSPTRWERRCLAAIMVAAAATTPVVRPGAGADPSAASTIVLAVLPFRDGGDGSLGRRLAEDLSASLAAVPGLEVVSQEDVHRALSSVAGEATLSEQVGALQAAMPVDWVVTGEIAWRAGQYEGTVRLLRSSTDEVRMPATVWNSRSRSTRPRAERGGA